jgi:tetratricopeptide (TPR) repeat protein
MASNTPILSEAFQRLYCNPAMFERISALHPVSFTRVLPFQAHDPFVDNPELLTAEAAHLANPNDATRLAVVEGFGRCNLLSTADVASLRPVADFFDADFFEFMGESYANAGMFICALRWYREFIAELETRRPQILSENESVYASVGYCLYSLGLYSEGITWSKSCIGARQTVEMMSRTLIEYELQQHGGSIRGVERAANRTRYTVSASDSAQANLLIPRLKDAFDWFKPIQETYIDWVSPTATQPQRQFDDESQSTFNRQLFEPLARHHMNLIFCLCGHADELTTRGYTAEAKRLLLEAALLEPKAEFVRDKLNSMS